MVPAAVIVLTAMLVLRAARRNRLFAVALLLLLLPVLYSYVYDLSIVPAKDAMITLMGCELAGYAIGRLGVEVVDALVEPEEPSDNKPDVAEHL